MTMWQKILIGVGSIVGMTMCAVAVAVAQTVTATSVTTTAIATPAAPQTCIFDFTRQSAGDNASQGIACTMDAKMCPDGSYVGRIAPHCNFAPCLAGATAPTTVTGSITAAAKKTFAAVVSATKDVATTIVTTVTGATGNTTTQTVSQAQQTQTQQTTNTQSTQTATGSVTVVSGQVGLLVPLYSEPGDTWTRLAAVAATGTPVVAIINPNSGPGGATPDAAYATGIAALHAAGVIVVGYTYTGYGQRSQDAVRTDIAAYLQGFGVDGVFLDEAANDAGHVAHYADLYAYARSLQSSARVILNPGTPTDSAYFAAADMIVQFEDTPTAWNAYTVPSAVAGHARAASAMLAHSVSSVDAMRAIVQRAVSAGFGYVYVTDDVLDNTWDTLPSYLDAERAALAGA